MGRTQKEEFVVKYTEYGLCITLDELRQLLEKAENQAKHNSMESRIYITGEEHPRIKQYCCYAECNPVDHTWPAK